ncbi:MAG: hypothetical protein OHK0046_07320 [Anaerolineae bacterium]
MRQLFIMIILGLLLAACGGSDGNNDLPTTIAPVAESTTEETTQPEESQPAEATATPTRAGRATLPPSWTPEPSETPLPPTATNTAIPTLEIIDAPPACNGFGPNTLETDETIQLGNSARVAWRPVEGARLYRIVVIDPQGNTILEELTDQTSYTISPNVFLAAVRYGWEVRPLDNVGIQMCPGRGGLLNVRP